VTREEGIKVSSVVPDTQSSTLSFSLGTSPGKLEQRKKEYGKEGEADRDNYVVDI
jgi:hypothetical protein